MKNIEVKTNEEFKMENVLSLRKKLKQVEVNEEINRIRKFFMDNNIKKTGPIVTATYNVEQVNGEQIIDMEVLVPMDKEIDLPEEYNLKERFHLVNAVYARHEGNPKLLQETYNKISQFMQENHLQQITPAYNVNVKDLSSGESMDNMIIDVYIGINPNIL